MFLYIWPDDDLYSRSKLVARKETITKSVLCVIVNIDTHYDSSVTGNKAAKCLTSQFPMGVHPKPVQYTEHLQHISNQGYL